MSIAQPVSDISWSKKRRHSGATVLTTEDRRFLASMGRGEGAAAAGGVMIRVPWGAVARPRLATRGARKPRSLKQLLALLAGSVCLGAVEAHAVDGTWLAAAATPDWNTGPIGARRPRYRMEQHCSACRRRHRSHFPRTRSFKRSNLPWAFRPTRSQFLRPH
jgi:hypothetical protein